MTANLRLSFQIFRKYIPETISTKNLVTLPITSQELGRGAFLPPNQIGLSNSPTTIGITLFMRANRIIRLWPRANQPVCCCNHMINFNACDTLQIKHLEITKQCS